MPIVIKEGYLKTTCLNCSSVIGYQLKEVNYTDYPQDDDPYILCPVCRQRITNIQSNGDHLFR